MIPIGKFDEFGCDNLEEFLARSYESMRQPEIQYDFDTIYHTITFINKEIKV